MNRYHIFILEKQINKTTSQTSHPATFPTDMQHRPKNFH